MICYLQNSMIWQNSKVVFSLVWNLFKQVTSRSMVVTAPICTCNKSQLTERNTIDTSEANGSKNFDD